MMTPNNFSNSSTTGLPSARTRWAWPILISTAVILVAAVTAISLVSRNFRWGEGHSWRPIAGFLSWYVLAWAGFATAACCASRFRQRGHLVFIVLVALVLRAVLFPSKPIQESDFYRYIWEGHVVLSGRNPAASPPAALDSSEIAGDPSDLEAAAFVKYRVSYPEVPTIYPPMAQLVFAQNAWLWGWDPHGFRKSLLIYDLLLMLVVFSLLRVWRLPSGLLLLYAWNPLVLKEVTNSMHIDIVCALFLALFLLAFTRKHYFFGLLALLAASLVKLTPLCLFPLAGYYMIHRGHWRRMLLYAAIMGILLGTAVGVAHLGTDQPLSGLAAFSTEWENNDSLLSLTVWALRRLPAAWTRGWDFWNTGKLLLLSVFMGGVLASYPWIRSRTALLNACGWALFWLFLVSPVGNPWYLVWLIPFFVIRRNWIWLLLMVSTSMYYMVFTIEYDDLGYAAYTSLRWREYLPVYLALVICGLWRLRVKLHRKPPDTQLDSAA